MPARGHQRPDGRVNGRFIGRAGREGFGEARHDRSAFGVLPLSADGERVAMAFLQDRPQLFSRHGSTLDPTGMEKDGRAGCRRWTRLLLIELQERLFHLDAVIASELEVAVDFAAHQLTREVDVEAERILRQPIGGRVNRRDRDTGSRCRLLGSASVTCRGFSFELAWRIAT